VTIKAQHHANGMVIERKVTTVLDIKSHENHSCKMTMHPPPAASSLQDLDNINDICSLRNSIRIDRGKYAVHNTLPPPLLPPN